MTLLCLIFFSNFLSVKHPGLKTHCPSPLGILADYVTMSGLSVRRYRKQLKLVWQEFKLILTSVHNTGIYRPVELQSPHPHPNTGITVLCLVYIFSLRTQHIANLQQLSWGDAEAIFSNMDTFFTLSSLPGCYKSQLLGKCREIV